jgi:hypothetical protein
MDLTERIKCYLRANRYYKKYFQTRVNDMRYAVRKYKYYAKYYSFKKDREIRGNTLFFIIDPAIKHPGLSDKFKAIAGCYYISKINGFDFKIIFETPFCLNDYLDTNECNWVAKRDDLSYSLKNSRVIPYNGGGKIPRLNKSVGQYHVYSYIGYDILESNGIPDYKTLWGTLYNSLFKPKDFIVQEMKATGFGKNKYIAVHLRFVNALEHFEEHYYNAVSQDKKEELIQRCQAGIRTIMDAHKGIPVIVFSDSNVFLTRVKELPVHVLDGKIGHISFNKEKDVITKTFVDFYMISEAQRVYVIKAPEMYATVFSCYAARAGYKDVTTINV